MSSVSQRAALLAEIDSIQGKIAEAFAALGPCGAYVVPKEDPDESVAVCSRCHQSFAAHLEEVAS